MMAYDLHKMKDLILPALWGRDPEGRSDLVVNVADDCLDMKVSGITSRLLSRQEIDDDTWKSVVKDRIDRAFQKGAS